jgi:ABC-type transporter Mla maintaining outer membrane lipid asymmetry ATPase subunit MlaF
MNRSLFECKGIGFQRGNALILNDVALTLSAGQRVVLYSESRLAAVAFLQICGTVLQPTRGAISFLGDTVDWGNEKKLLKLKRKIVFNDRRTSLIQNLSVFENIALSGVYHENMSLKDAQIHLEPIIKMFNLESLLQLRPSDLDPEMKRRILYAIEAAKVPELAIFIQPESDNDRPLYMLLNYLRETSHCACILYTESRTLLDRWGDEVVVLKDGTLSPPVNKATFLVSLNQQSESTEEENVR